MTEGPVRAPLEALHVSSFAVPITTEPTPNALPSGGGRASIGFAVDDKPASVGLWLFFSGSTSPGDVNDLAAGILDVWIENIQPVLSAQCLVKLCEVVLQDGASEQGGHASTSEPGAGGGAALPANSSAVISWHDGSSYRGGKPRTYVPGIDADSLLNLYLYTDEFVGSLRSGANAFIDGIAALAPIGDIDTVTLGCWHRWRAGVALDPPEFRPYASAGVQPRVCTQRRRLGHTLPS